jgi:GntR family transcriptional regulator
VEQPLYAQLKEALIAAIRGGDLARGDKLPSQRELCERYRMSHMTVRRAISELLNEGVIYAIHGKGLYVAERKQDAERGLVGFSEEMARRGMTVASHVIAAEVTSASTVLAEALSVAPGTALVHLRRLRLVDGQPMAIQTGYLPHALCPGLLAHDLTHQSLYDLLRGHYGLRLAESMTVVETALADDEQAWLLGLTLPAPMLITEQISYLDDGRAVEFVRTAYRGDRYRLRMRERE